jgi:putative phosphoesterase
MRLGIISDTHGSVKAWEDALNGPFRGVDLILHAGDVLYHGPRNPLPDSYDPSKLADLINQCPLPILIAKGNCDSEVDQMVISIPLQAPYLLTEQPLGRILVSHGHFYNDELIQSMMDSFGVNIWITGHTHVPVLEQRGVTVYLNPGSPALPKGTEPRRSVALVSETDIKLLDLDSGKPYSVMEYHPSK